MEGRAVWKLVTSTAICRLTVFNTLKPKPISIKQKNSVSTAKQHNNSPITKIDWLMLLREIIAFNCENLMKLINVFCGQNAVL